MSLDDQQSEPSDKEKTNNVRLNSAESDTDLQNYVQLNDQAISLSIWD